MSNVRGQGNEVRKLASEFARAEIAPHARKWDETSHFPREIFTKLGEMGFLGVVIPEEYGGAGLSYRDYVAIIEGLAAVEGGSRSPLRRTTRCARTTSFSSATRARSGAGCRPSRAGRCWGLSLIHISEPTR